MPAAYTRVDIVTGSTGDFTASVPVPYDRLLQMRYVPNTSTAAIITTGADLRVTGAVTGIEYVSLDDFGTTAAYTRAPRHTIHTTTGSTGTFGSTALTVADLQRDYIFLGGEQLTVAVTSTGAAKTGSLFFWTG